MGAKTWMLVYSDSNARDALRAHPELDREATVELAATLFPRDTLEPLEDGNLMWTCPRSREICIGSFPGVSVVAAKEFGIDNPSKLPTAFLEAARDGTVSLHAMHSVVDWFAYAQWKSGQLIRSLSLSPDDGVIEDIGERMPFEKPFWAGEHPVVDGEQEVYEYPLPFHPLELGEAALRELFGYQLEGFVDPSLLDPETIPLMQFKRRRLWWKFW